MLLSFCHSVTLSIYLSLLVLPLLAVILPHPPVTALTPPPYFSALAIAFIYFPSFLFSPLILSPFLLLFSQTSDRPQPKNWPQRSLVAFIEKDWRHNNNLPHKTPFKSPFLNFQFLEFPLSTWCVISLERNITKFPNYSKTGSRGSLLWSVRRTWAHLVRRVSVSRSQGKKNRCGYFVGPWVIVKCSLQLLNAPESASQIPKHPVSETEEVFAVQIAPFFNAGVLVWSMSDSRKAAGKEKHWSHKFFTASFTGSVYPSNK